MAANHASRLRFVPSFALIFVGAALLIQDSLSPNFLVIFGFKISFTILGYGIIILGPIMVIDYLINSLKYWMKEAKREYSANSNWQIEEVRGIFVLGIIGTIVLIDRKDVAAIDPSGTLSLLINFLLVCWGAYAVFMAIAIPNDWLNKWVKVWSFFLAKSLFVFGICGMLLVTLTSVTSYILFRGILPNFVLPSVITGFILLGSILFALFVLPPRNEGVRPRKVAVVKSAKKLSGITARKLRRVKK